MLEHCAAYLNKTPTPGEEMIIEFLAPAQRSESLNPTKLLRRFVHLGADRFALCEVILEASAPTAMKRHFLNMAMLAMHTDIATAMVSYHDMLEEAGGL